MSALFNTLNKILAILMAKAAEKSIKKACERELIEARFFNTLNKNPGHINGQGCGKKY